MSVARLLYRGYTGEPVIYSDTAEFGELLITKQQAGYSGASANIDFSLTAGPNGGYIPATLRGVDSQFTVGGVYQGRLSFCPKYGTQANRELTWCGCSASNRAGANLWGLFTRVYTVVGSPASQPAQMGLTQQTDPSDPLAINTGMTYAWTLNGQASLDDALHLIAYDTRGAGSTVGLIDFDPLDASPSANYQKVDYTYTSWVKNAGQATIADTGTTVVVPAPYVDVAGGSIIMLTWADNVSPLSQKLWTTAGVAGTSFIINTDSPITNVLGSKVNWFIVQY